MTLWLAAGGLLCSVCGALAWRALRGRDLPSAGATEVYRDQQQALQRAAAAGDVERSLLPGLRNELARAALDDAAREATAAPVTSIERQSLALLVAVVLPAVTLPVYLQFGHPAPAPEVTAENGQPPHMSAAEMVAELERRIAANSADPEPRLWLARVRMTQGDYAAAIAVFEKLQPLAPDDPAVLLQFADALSMADQGRIGEKARGLIAHALEIEPRNLVGLWLSGLAADQTGQPRQALDYLVRARATALAQKQPSDEIDTLIAEVARRAELPLPAALASTPDAAEASVDAPGASSSEAALQAAIDVAVTVAPGAAVDLPPDTVVYVLAKAATGPPMPLAVKRMTLGELPATVRLDDSLALAPQLRLSNAAEVVVTARVSRSGEPVARSGDVQGSSPTLRVGQDTAVSVKIAERVP